MSTTQVDGDKLQGEKSEKTQRKKVSQKAGRFTESVIRQMSRLAKEHQAINLAQGFPDFPCPMALKEAASKALFEDINQYPVTWGDPKFRQAIAEKSGRYLGLNLDPEKHITVTCGSTEAMMAAMLAVVDPGDEVIVLEPFYENYGPDAILAGAIPRYVTLHPPAWTFDEAELKKAFNSKTKAIILNTPHNPTGKVFTKAELTMIAELCQHWGVLVFTDEIYEHILYDGAEHVAMASIPGMEDLTVTINALSKTYSVTGWRVGYMLACEELTDAIRKVHDFLTVAAAAPLQRAGVTAMNMPQSYYDELTVSYTEKRTAMLQILDEVGIPYYRPEGAYYTLADISKFGFDTDFAFTRHLVKDIGVAVVPGSSFFRNPEDGYGLVRFCFSKTQETLEAARQRLIKLK
ncbi:MAG: aminotransferase class I/II-fold pyridoxal phosphate-dependent enzyme [Vampirovibrio sp.]|nr:aminotransferase class I/II-fold pyridoxal phosphate-dependent enzyme [Vampirovibrio sp.]